MFKFRRKVKKGYLDDRQNGGIDDIVKIRQQTMSSTDVKEDVHEAQEERNVTTIVSDNPKCKVDYKSDNQETQSKTKKTTIRLNEYIGQERIVKNLKVYISSAKHRDSSLDHILLYGPPGTGKETLVYAIANEMGVHVEVIKAKEISKALEFSAILSKLEKGDIVYIDEIHRLNRNIEEILYPAMEDFTIDMVTGAGAMASCLTMNLKPFTLIGTTEREEMVSRHLRERFGMKFRLTHYSIEEMQKFVKMFAKEKNVLVDEDAELEIAKYCEGVPIVAKKMLDRVKDYAEYEGLEKIDIVLAKKAMKNISVEEVHPYKLDEEIK